MKKRGLSALLISLSAVSVLSFAAVFGGLKPLKVSAESEGSYLTNIDFTKTSDFDNLKMLSAGIDPATNSTELGYTSDGWVTYGEDLNKLFTLDANGLSTKTIMYSGDDVSENNIYVRYNEKQYRYFEAETVYSYNSEARNGWAGFMLGYSNFTRKARWGDSPFGVEIFVQKEGKGTYSSAKLNNSGYTEGTVPANWTALGTHTLKVVAVDSGITLYADGTSVVSISKAAMQACGYELTTANMGFFLNNADFTVKSFSFSPLNAAGDVYQPVEGIEVSAPAEAEQYAPVTVDTVISPASATLQTVGYTLPDCAVVSDGKIYFAKAGTFDITAYSIDKPDVKKTVSIKINPAENFVGYPLSVDSMTKSFDNYFVTNGSAKDGVSTNWADYWNVNDDGSITIKEKFKSGVDTGYVLLYLKDLVNGLAVKSNSFELTYMVKTDSSTPNGWHGVGLAMQDRATVPNQNGVSAFIQEDALKATIWGSGEGGVGGPSEVDSSYTKGQWNIIKVKVYGDTNQKIEMYVNNLSTPIVTADAVNLTSADIAIFTTTVITVKDINYAKLDNSGNAVEIVYPEQVSVTNKISTATVGDKFQINAAITPADVSDSSLIYSSSSALTAAVSPAGLVTFMNAGTVTFTVSCVGNPAVKDEFTVTVKEKEVLPTSVSFDAVPTSAKVGDKYTLFVTVSPENATNYGVKFVSSNQSVATVDADGRLKYVGAGKTTITVICDADETVKASFELTVTGNESSSESKASSGCSGSMGQSAAAVLAVAALGALILLRNKENV